LYKKARSNPYLPSIAEYFKDKDSKTFSRRIEGDNLDIYTNDEVLLDEIIKRFNTIVSQCWYPHDTLKNEDKIICNKLPHSRYRYKVYLLPHKMKYNFEGKTKYLNWLETQGQKISISNIVKSWFLTTDYNWARRYMYVEDEKTLLLLRMRCPEVVGRIYEYSIVDK